MDMVPQAMAMMVRVILFLCFFRSLKKSLKIKNPLKISSVLLAADPLLP
jgi:hypothetical protein